MAGVFNPRFFLQKSGDGFVVVLHLSDHRQPLLIFFIDDFDLFRKILNKAIGHADLLFDGELGFRQVNVHAVIGKASADPCSNFID